MDAAQRIAGWRAFRELTQRKLAERAGVTAAAVYQWEKGTTSPSLATLAAIVEALGVTMVEFWGSVPAPKKRKAS